MKNTKPILRITILSLVLLFTACEDFLDEVDHTNITADSFFPTEVGIESLVNACYTPLRFYYGKEFSLVYTELGTDIITAGNGCIDNPYTYYRNDMVRMIDKDRDKNSDYWRYFYIGLNNANSAVKRVPISDLPIATKRNREGEVLFLRAFYLWHIVNIWGGVHFTNTENTEATAELNMTDESVFYDQIIKDLQKAIPLLPVSSTDYGRVTKPAAQAFLARAYLYTKDYENAYAYADSVIKGYGFQLVDNFADLWDVNNEINDEVIWSVMWSENDEYSAAILEGQQDEPGEWQERAPGNQLHLFFVMVYQEVTIDGKSPMVRDIENGRSFNRLIPSLFLLDLYDETIDSRFDATYQSIWKANRDIYFDDGDSMIIGDTCIYVTKHDVSDDMRTEKPYAIFDRSDLYEADGSPIGARRQNFTLRKFLDPTRDPDNVDDQSSKFDVYVFRLAEMHFIAAEAQMYLGNTEEAAEQINIIRRRAAYDGSETQMEISATDITLDFILDEKAREFAGEYCRWFDLKRTNKLVERVRLHNTDAAPNIQTYHRNRPIPENELQAVTNKDEFHQWDGYN